MWLTWAALALVLSKGLVGLVLPALALIGYMASVRNLSIWPRLRLLTGLAVFLVIVSPWFVAVQLQNPEFFQFFFIKEHFQRFAASGHHRVGPWCYFIVIGVVVNMQAAGIDSHKHLTAIVQGRVGEAFD